MFKRVKHIRLRNNQPVIIRQATPNDVHRLMTMHHWVSDESLYKRYLRHTDVEESEMRMISQLTPDQGVAYVAVLEGARDVLIGYGYYVIDPAIEPLTGEFALLVQDDYQGLGLGGALLQLIIDHALRHEVSAFDIVVAANNDAMMHLIRRTGFSFELESDHGIHEIAINLEPAAQSSFRVINETERVIEHILRRFGAA
jgi:acetyltransferase